MATKEETLPDNTLTLLAPRPQRSLRYPFTYWFNRNVGFGVPPISFRLSSGLEDGQNTMWHFRTGPMWSVYMDPSPARNTRGAVVHPPRRPIWIRDGTETCAVCLGPVAAEGRMMRCDHAFCTSCIDDWIASSPAHRSVACPVCRCEIAINHDDDRDMMGEFLSHPTVAGALTRQTRFS
jgi:Zinc finger, C3HC4 type (RING finger)